MKEMKGNKLMNFNLDAETADKFKMLSVKKRTTMAELFRDMVAKAIELDIYVNLNKEDK